MSGLQYFSWPVTVLDGRQSKSLPSDPHVWPLVASCIHSVSQRCLRARMTSIEDLFLVNPDCWGWWWDVSNEFNHASRTLAKTLCKANMGPDIHSTGTLWENHIHRKSSWWAESIRPNSLLISYIVRPSWRKRVDHHPVRYRRHQCEWSRRGRQKPDCQSENGKSSVLRSCWWKIDAAPHLRSESRRNQAY